MIIKITREIQITEVVGSFKKEGVGSRIRDKDKVIVK